MDDEMTPLRVAAVSLHETYRALLAAGFTEIEALTYLALRARNQR